MTVTLNSSWQQIASASTGFVGMHTAVIYARIDWQSQDSMKSAVLTKMEIQGSSYSHDQVTSFTLTGSGGWSGDWSASSTTTVVTGGYEQGHDANGYSSPYISGCATFGGTGKGTGTFGATVNLPRITPKSSTVTYTPSQPSINTYPNNSPNITAGQQCYIHCNQTSSDIRHNCYYTIGNKTEYIKYDFQTNTAWTPSTDLCAQFPNFTTGSGTIYLQSYVNGSLIGTKSCNFILALPSGVTPDITINSITEQNSNVSSITTNETIQSLSSKKVTVTASAKWYASISNVWCNGVQLSSIGNNQFQGTLSNMQTGNYSVSVRDSRGYTNSTTRSQNYYNYSYPTLSGSAARNGPTDFNGALTVSGTYSAIKSNTVKMTVTRNGTAQTISPTISDGSISLTQSYTDLDYVATFLFVVTITDSFNQSKTINISLSLGEYALWIGKNSIDTPRINVKSIYGMKTNDASNCRDGSKAWCNYCSITTNAKWHSDSLMIVVNGYIGATAIIRIVPSNVSTTNNWTNMNIYIDVASYYRNFFSYVVNNNELQLWVYNQGWGPITSVVYRSFRNSEYTITGGTQSPTTSNPGTLLTLWALVTTYPIGSVYMSTSSTSPATLFGGSWSNITDRFLVGAGSSYGAGSTGGSSTHVHSTGEHTITTNEMPSHTHWAGRSNQGGGRTDWGLTGGGAHGGNVLLNPGNGSCDTGYSGSNWSHNHGNTGSSSTIPPYYAVYIWVRTA